MSEYEALKAQRDALGQKERHKYIEQGAAAERDRIREAVQLIEPDDITPNYMRGYVDAVKEVLSLLKDGDANDQN